MEDVVRLFGYGSLLNIDSLKKTMPHAHDIFPVRLYGYQRIFNFPSAYRLDEATKVPSCVLNLEPADAGVWVSGICFSVYAHDVPFVMERERGYDLIDVELKDWQTGETVAAKAFIAPHVNGHGYVFDSGKQDEYLKLCVDGARAFGEEFLQNFFETTYIGERNLLAHGLDKFAL